MWRSFNACDPRASRSQLLASQPLPRLAGSRHYVNLTNGIEAIPALEALGLPYRCRCSRSHSPPPLSSPCERMRPTRARRVSHVCRLPAACSFCRLTSTACEQQDYDKVLTELDADLLVSLALGRSCLVWDAGCRHQRSGCPRALWLGLEWVRFALTRLHRPAPQPQPPMPLHLHATLSMPAPATDDRLFPIPTPSHPHPRLRRGQL